MAVIPLQQGSKSVAAGGSGTVTSVATGGIATGGTITTTGTITVAGSGNTTTAATAASSVASAPSGDVITADGSGNVQDSGTLLSALATLHSPTFTGTVVLPSGQALIAPVLGTPTSGTLTNCTFPTLNQNTTGSAGSLTVLTTLGDILYENATPANARLAGNTTSTKNFLTQTGTGTVSAVPAWGTIAAGDVPTLNQNTTGSAGSVLFSGVGAATNANALVVGTGGSLTFSGTGTVNANQVNGLTMALGSPSGGMVPLYHATSTAEYVTGYHYKSLINVVAEYGADNTGGSETHTAVQNAMAAVSSTRPGLYFPAGTYLITTAITDPSSGVLQFIVGDGIDKCVLTTNSTNSIFNFTHVTDGTAIDDFQISDLKFVTTNTPPTTIGAVNGVNLSNANSNGGGTNCVGVHIRGCAFEYFSGFGFSVTNPILSTMENCLYYGNGAGGYYSTGGTTTTFIDTYSNFNVGRGYSINSCQAMSFVSSAADNNGVGYYLNTVNAVDFAGVDCEACTPYTQSITTVASSGGTATITATNSLAAGNWVVVLGLTGGNVALNGTWQVATASGSQFTFAVAGTIGSNSPSGATFSAYPGWGIQLVGCEGVTINGYQNFLASTKATQVAIFMDQTTYGTSINGYYQNTAGGTNDIYCAPGSNNVEIKNSFPIGAIFSTTGTNVVTSNIGTLHGGIAVTQSNASAATGLAVTLNSSGAPVGLSITDQTNYANTSPLVSLTQANGTDTGTCITMSNSGTGNDITATNWAMAQAGKLTKYDGLTLAGLGMSPTLYSYDASTAFGVFNTAAAVTMLASSAPAGFYQITYYMVITTSFVTNTEVTLKFAWTDPDQATALTLTTAAKTAGTYLPASAGGTITASVSNSFSFHSTGATAITWTPGVTGSNATAGAAWVSVVLERLA